MPRLLRNLLRLVLEAVCGGALSLLFYFVAAGIFMQFDFGSCKTGPLLGMMTGAPVGCLAGIVIVDRFFRPPTWNLWGMGLSLLLFEAALFGLLQTALDGFLKLAVTTIVSAVVGYEVGRLLHRKSKLIGRTNGKPAGSQGTRS